ncbi:MAG TPA: signal peptidase I [Beijerinckiaceae bacterium]|nr:signal peptidase I [Rhodoblastus sp.]MCB9999307.1 signal peptidase I [Methylobacteriaceae bacterium]MCC2106355.1 signal peptidase I [Hyphomicrobiales bacterium]HRY04707.1 signal peptidase I [Beijerinckiaceae bacterium]MCB1524053.1 signal peptidase I [Rhodoblastus sp.]
MSEPLGLDADKSNSQKHAEGGFGETVKVVIQALLIALVVRTLLFQPFNIPSGSMIPTLLIGDFLFVSKYSYGYSRYSIPFSPDLFSGRILASKPKRGDVVVFKLPRDTSSDYIKRVIGLPGDKIQMVEGRLQINGKTVPREPIAKVRTEDRFGRLTEVPTYKETLPGGVSHTIIEIEGDTGFNDNTGVFEVPPDHYFMMGDNRDNSTDSRVPPEQGGVGYVPSQNLVGRAEMIFFSVRDGAQAWEFWRWPWTVRFSRLFQPVR